jgi:DNA-binding transcriptional regulator WhiA
MEKRVSNDKKLHAYIIGLALGDGNLSNPNGRAVRLRVTCDKKYPVLFSCIKTSLQNFLPDNVVSIVDRKTCVDVSCYSNKFEKLLGWKAGGGSKIKQKVRIPEWILRDKIYIRECLRGIIQTDGSIFNDRGYKMVNIVSSIPSLAHTVVHAITIISYKPNMQIHQDPNNKKHTIRISKNTDKFIKDVGVWKK